MLSRVIWAAQTTVIISAAVILTGGLALGVGLGLLAGYAGGKVDDFIMRVADAFFALPDILLLLLIATTVRDRVDDLFLGQSPSGRCWGRWWTPAGPTTSWCSARWPSSAGWASRG